MEKYQTQIWEGEHAKIDKKVNVGWAKNDYNYRIRLLTEYLEKNGLMSEFDDIMDYINHKSNNITIKPYL